MISKVLEQIKLAVERERVDEANTILRIQNENLISEGKWNDWSIVIQVHNRLDLLKECFKSIAEARFNIEARKMRLIRNFLRNMYIRSVGIN